jgi:hypothetical protein
MKVGVLSDSHGELENLVKASKILLNKKVERVIHLGDNYEDTKVIEDTFKVIKVPGVFSEYYQKEEIPNRIIKEIEGKRVLITHTERSHENDLPGDIKPEEVNKDVVLYGHTHVPKIEEREGILYVNPGHLKSSDKKGFPPSLAIINFKDLSVEIFDLNGRLVKKR